MASANMDARSIPTKAESGACQLTREWVCQTLRESFLQSLSSRWAVRKSADPLKNVDICITKENVNESVDVVQQLASKWRAKLEAIGHLSSAEIISEVSQGGRPSFWLHPSTTQQEKADVSSLPSKFDTKERDSAWDPSVNGKTSKFPMQALASLAEQCRSSAGNSLDDTFRKIHKLGSEGASYWPLSWKPVDDALHELPDRLYRKTGDHASTSKIEESLKKIRQHQKSEPDKPLFLSKKIQSEDSNDIRRKTKRRKPDVSGSPIPMGRLPSSIHSLQFSMEDIVQSLSAGDIDRLSGLLHPESESSNRPIILIGAAKKLGQYHFYNQRVDEAELSNKQIRRKRNMARKERIETRVSEKSDAPKSYQSKVVRTIGRTDPDGHFLDFDLGECLFEVPRAYSDVTGHSFLAFSHLEIVLRDESTDSSKAFDNPT